MKIASYADWCLYNDIFVEGEYDKAIDSALTAASGRDSFQLVDLGANVGFFTLRVFDRMFRTLRMPGHINVLCVEGSPPLRTELDERLGASSSERVNITIVTGLVGKRTGAGTLELAPSQVMNRVTADPVYRRCTVPYVDLMPLLSGVERIDLLKCDIEGSEISFLQNYPEVMNMTQVAAFEFHAVAGSLETGPALVMNSGFSKQTVLLDHGAAQTVVFER